MNKFFLRRRYKKWHVRFTLNGKLYERSTGERCERKARKRAKEIYDEISVSVKAKLEMETVKADSMGETDGQDCISIPENVIFHIIKKNPMLSEYLSFVQRRRNNHILGRVSRVQLFVELLKDCKISCLTRTLIEPYWGDQNFLNDCPTIAEWIKAQKQRK